MLCCLLAAFTFGPLGLVLMRMRPGKPACCGFGSTAILLAYIVPGAALAAAAMLIMLRPAEAALAFRNICSAFIRRI